MKPSVILMRGGHLSVETAQFPGAQTPCLMRLARTVTLENATMRTMHPNNRPMPPLWNAARSVPLTCRPGASGQTRTISCSGATSENVVRQSVQPLNPASPTLMRDPADSPAPPHPALTH